MPIITLPDGSQRSFDAPVSVHDVAFDIGPGLAKAALAGKVDGELVDTSHENCGILLISHDLHTVMTATDHVVCLNGHVCCSGSPMDVAKNNEYKTLFGEQASQILSVYEHKHDHVHSDKGEIKKN